jgi:hypothetical protein
LTASAASIAYFLLINDDADPIRAIISIKFITGATVYFFTTKIRAEKLVFYYNLSYRPFWLWTVSFALDMSILALLLIMTSAFR